MPLRRQTAGSGLKPGEAEEAGWHWRDAIPGGRGKPQRDGGWIAASEAGTGGCGGFFDCQPDAFPVYFP